MNWPQRYRWILLAVAMGLPVFAAAQPRLVRTRAVITDSNLVESFEDSVLASIKSETARLLSQRCAEKYPFLNWQPVPLGSGSADDTLPLLTVLIITRDSGKARLEVLAELQYCIDGVHDQAIPRFHDDEVLFRGDDSASRTPAALRQRLWEQVLRMVGRDIPELPSLHDDFIPRVAIVDSIDVPDSSRSAPILLPIQADVLRAKQESRLLAKFCSVIDGDTVRACRFVLHPVGDLHGRLACSIAETQCGLLQVGRWMEAIRGRERCGVHRLRVYMDEYVFDRFRDEDGTDTRP